MSSLYKRISMVLAPAVFTVALYTIIYLCVRPNMQYISMFYGYITAHSDNSNVYVQEETFTPSENSEEPVNYNDISEPGIGALFASISFDDKESGCGVYYFPSDDELVKGCGLLCSNLPGYGKTMVITGSNSYLPDLKEIKEGDSIFIKTSYGKYTYSVTETAVSADSDASMYDLSNRKEQLIIYTQFPFDVLGFTGERFYVYADKVAGPDVLM